MQACTIGDTGRAGDASASRAPPALGRMFDGLVTRLGLPRVCAAIARFLCVGLAGLAVDSSVFSLVFAAGAGPAIARAVSLPVATVVTWFVNRHFTFAPTRRAPRRELARYCGVALAVQGFNYLLFMALVLLLDGTHPLACLVASAAMTAALSFVAHHCFTFARETRNAGASASR